MFIKKFIFLAIIFTSQLILSMDNKIQSWILEDIDYIIFEECIKKDLEDIQTNVKDLPLEQKQNYAKAFYYDATCGS